MTSNYNKYPATKVEGYHVFCGCKLLNKVRNSSH